MPLRGHQRTRRYNNNAGALLYGFGEVVLTNDASKFRRASRRCSTAGSRDLHPSRNVAEPGGLQRWRAY